MLVCAHRLDQPKHLHQEVSFRNGIVVSPNLERCRIVLARGNSVDNPARDDEILSLLDDVFLAVKGEIRSSLYYHEMFGGVWVKVRFDTEFGSFLRNPTTEAATKWKWVRAMSEQPVTRKPPDDPKHERWKKRTQRDTCPQ